MDGYAMMWAIIMEIGVEWYERDISGGEERRIFRARMADDDAPLMAGTVYSFNSTELRMINVEMQLVPQPNQKKTGLPTTVLTRNRCGARNGTTSTQEASCGTCSGYRLHGSVAVNFEERGVSRHGAAAC